MVEVENTVRENHILREVDRLLYTYGINKVIRYSKSRVEEYQTQSVAEHVANMIFCAYYFRDLEDVNREIDMDRVVRLIIMHDMGEIETGDIVTTHKTANHTEMERQAIQEVKNKSPDFVSREIENVFESFENPQSKEERFARAIDKFEGLLFWFPDDGIKMIKSFDKVDDTKYYFEKTEKAIVATGMNNVLEYFLIMKNDMIKRGVFK